MQPKSPHDYFSKAARQAPAPADEPLPPPPPVSDDQLMPLVHRVEDLIVTYSLQGRRLGVTLQTATLLGVIDKALRQAEGEAVPALTEGTPEEFLAEDLYEELTQQPESVFDKVVDKAGEEHWIPLDMEVWRRCLRKLRAEIAAENPS